MFAGIGAFANVLHALTVAVGGAVMADTLSRLDIVALARAVILSATLPMLAVYLGEVVSSDDARVAEMAERERARAERDRTAVDTQRQLAEERERLAEVSRQLEEAHAHGRPGGVDVARRMANKSEFFDMMANGNGDRPQSATDLARRFGVALRTADRRWAEWRDKDKGTVPSST